MQTKARNCRQVFALTCHVTMCILTCLLLAQAIQAPSNSYSIHSFSLAIRYAFVL